MEILLGVALLVLVIAHLRLRARVETLEKLAGERLTPAPDTAPDARPARDAKPAPTDAPSPWQSARASAPNDPPAQAADRTTHQAETQPTAPAGPGAATRLGHWLVANWIYPVAGAALFFAALYLVQYSIDNNLLSPSTRIVMALMLGLGLVAGAEFTRRRWSAEQVTLVPATLAGAGVSVLFLAILAAFHLYDLISAGTCLTGLALVAMFTIALGWIHGPLLTGLGVGAGFAAPFLLGEGGNPRDLLYGYFGVIALAGLLIDGYRRWIWVSALSVLGALLAAGLIAQVGAGQGGLIVLVGVLCLVSCSVPFGQIWPGRVHAAPLRRPAYDCSALFIATVLGGLLIVVHVDMGWNAIALSGLAAGLTLWTLRSSEMSDIVLIPAILALGAIAGAVLDANGPIAALMRDAGWTPLTVLALLTGTALGLLRHSRPAVIDFLGLGSPVAALVLMDQVWGVSALQGVPMWAGIAMALAALYTALAVILAKEAPASHGTETRVGLTIVAAFALIALSLTWVLSAVALTVALGVLLVTSVLIDRRFNLPTLGLAFGAASAGLVWRVLVDPGMVWALLPAELGGAHGPEVAALILAALTPVGGLLLMRNNSVLMRDLGGASMALGAGVLLPAAVVMLLERFLWGATDYAGFGVQISVLAAFALRNRARAQGLTTNRIVARAHAAVAVIQALLATGMTATVLTLLNPMLGPSWFGQPVAGVPVINDLMLGYLLPALVLMGLGYRFLTGWLRHGAFALGGVLGVAWVQLTIRHAWQGAEGMTLTQGIGQGELYTYTVALLILGGSTLLLAMRHPGVKALRWVAMAVIGTAAIKAFVWDAAGLEGLMRVGAFLGLGISLVGLAWLNSRIQAVQGQPQEPS